LAIGKEGQNARLAAKLTGWRIDIKSTSALEAEKASLDREAVAEEEEPVPEFVTAEELSSPVAVSEAEATGEPEPVGEEETAELAAASTDFELVLASEVSSPAKSAEARQIRFAEDILSPKTDKAKKKSGKKDTKKDTDLPKGKSRPKKTRSRPASYSEEDEFEE
jgi:hypothetical protein